MDYKEEEREALRQEIMDKEFWEETFRLLAIQDGIDNE